MHLTFRNVNDALRGLVGLFHEASNDGRDQSASDVEIIRTNSRNGPVLQILEPVIITYTHPRERVLFNQARDCNPFFHLFESLWMLAGRNDLQPLQYYVSTFGQFSDDGKTLNGAYGYRWRHGSRFSPLDSDFCPQGFLQFKDVDQLQLLINHLKANPHSRRAVLQMWNVEDDLLKVDTSKDVCCNLSVCFSIREGVICPNCGGKGHHSDPPEDCLCETGWQESPRLDMTVFNRSNDLILGMLGANVVHFSMLQEYMAACIGVEVGVYNQISNNLHVYESNWEPEKWLADKLPTDWYPDNIGADHRCPFPLVKDPAAFDREVVLFIDDPEQVWQEPFLRAVAAPMCTAFRHHKEKDYIRALEALDYVMAEDWKIAGVNWITKRARNWQRKQEKQNADVNATVE